MPGLDLYDYVHRAHPLPSLTQSLGAKSDFNQMDKAFLACLKVDNVALDGELVVWNKAKMMFENFGANRAVLSAVDKGMRPDDRLEVRCRAQECRGLLTHPCTIIFCVDE